VGETVDLQQLHVMFLNDPNEVCCCTGIGALSDACSFVPNRTMDAPVRTLRAKSSLSP
jgi:hypothetical protein